MFGLYLSGEKYSKIVCLYGGGGNGKSVLSRMLGNVLGGMSHLDCPKALLFDVADKMGRSGDFSLRQDMLIKAANNLESKGLLVCDEVGKGLCLNKEEFKQITGGGHKMSKVLQPLCRQAAAKVAHENWRRLGKESSQLARADYLRIFTKKLAIAGIRAQASWLAGRYEQAIAQMDGAAAPDKRARDQDRRARHESEEYWSANAGFTRADFRTQ